MGVSRTLTVIIPTNRGPAVIERCLGALAEQRGAAGAFDVYIVRNGTARCGLEARTPQAGTPQAGTPQAGTPQAGTPQAHTPQAPTPHAPTPRTEGWPFELHVDSIPEANVCAAKNHALRRARGEFVLFINDDLIAGPDLVRTHLDAHERLGRPALVAGRATPPAWPDETVMDRLVADTSMLFFYDQMTPRAWHGFRHGWTLNLSGPRRLLAAEGFDEELGRTFYYEDVELAWRIERGLGRCVWYEPAACGVHEHRYRFEQYLEREAGLGLAALTLWRRNPACFRSIFESDLDEDYLAYCRAYVEREGARERPRRQRLGALLARPIGELGGDSAVRRELIDALYAAHVPLKRLAHRRALVAAVQAADRERPPCAARRPDVAAV